MFEDYMDHLFDSALKGQRTAAAAMRGKNRKCQELIVKADGKTLVDEPRAHFC